MNIFRGLRELLYKKIQIPCYPSNLRCEGVIGHDLEASFITLRDKTLQLFEIKRLLIQNRYPATLNIGLN